MDTSEFVAFEAPTPDYTVVQQLETSGATSTCYKVRLYGRLLFMKRLKPEFVQNPNYRSAFQKEFVTGYNLQHAHLANYIQMDEDAEGPFILTEYIDGETLDSFINKEPAYFQYEKNLCLFLKQLLEVLHYLHSNQVLFLDMKPDNIMLTNIEKQLKLIDLGCCKTDSFDGTAGRNLQFAAPEQLSGEQVDVRADIYAVGKLLQHISQMIEKPLPAQMRKIAARCMQDDKEKRYHSVQEILQELDDKKLHSMRYVWWVSLVACCIIGGIFLWGKSNSKPIYDFEHEGIFYKVLNAEKHTCAVTRKDTLFKYTGNIWIPAQVNHEGIEYQVTQIADSAFFNSNQMMLVNIPNSINRIGVRAFHRCEGLSTLNIPDGVDAIGENAFEGCLTLNDVKLPSSLKAIPNAAFSSCANLSSVQIPEGLENIGIDSFGYCFSLKHIKLPSTLKQIGQGAFWHCYRLEDITIPSMVNTIGDYVFTRCDSLSVIYDEAPIPQRITNIFSDSLIKPINVYVPKGSAPQYSAAQHWNRLNIVEN